MRISPIAKRIALSGVLLAVVLAAFLFVRKPIVNYATDVITFVKEYSNAHDDMLQALRQEVFTQPLRANIAGDRSNLTAVDIIRLTNQERDKQNLPLLVRNAQLDQSATRKLQDMFDRQYFDHISPDGKGPGYLADKAGYRYVVVGENLAMGTFDTNEALVKAWMDSTGHRENILNRRYMDIGVAVGHGTFNGERIWIAVQEFGKPIDACPVIDGSLRVRIDENKTKAAAMSEDIKKRKTALESLPHSSSEETTYYNQKISEYNELVSSYNSLLEELRSQIDTYNQSVREFNSCAKQ